MSADPSPSSSKPTSPTGKRKHGSNSAIPTATLPAAATALGSTHRSNTSTPSSSPVTHTLSHQYPGNGHAHAQPSIISSIQSSSSSSSSTTHIASTRPQLHPALKNQILPDRWLYVDVPKHKQSTTQQQQQHVGTNGGTTNGHVPRAQHHVETHMSISPPPPPAPIASSPVSTLSLHPTPASTPTPPAALASPHTPPPTPAPASELWVQSDLLNLSDVESPRVLLVGEEGLRVVCDPVEDVFEPSFLKEKRRLHRALFDFRATHGFGRSIAAPQIGITSRFLAINMGAGPYTLINPMITWRSPELMTLWDDCMSFPWLMVRKQRHRSVSVSFVGDDGQQHVWDRLDPSTSELLQHELDHLDGILALDAPFGPRHTALVSRDVYLRERDKFDRQVDYRIVATV